MACAVNDKTVPKVKSSAANLFGDMVMGPPRRVVRLRAPAVQGGCQRGGDAGSSRQQEARTIRPKSGAG
jgi:hypothetical protein